MSQIYFILVYIYIYALNKKKNLYQQIGLKFEEETGEMLCLEHGSVRC